MRLKELFETWNKNPVLFAIATNGLDPNKDKVLAIALTSDLDKGLDDLFLNETHGDELMKAQKFHTITEELMRYAIPESDFIENIKNSFNDAILLSYNAPFQHAFLSSLLQEPSLSIFDLSIIEQALRKGLSFDEEEMATPYGFYQACQARYFPLPVNTICKNLKFSRQPAPGELPVAHSLEILKRLYSEASYPEVQLLQN